MAPSGAIATDSSTRGIASHARIVVNAGCGAKGTGMVPSMFDRWRQLRVDVDPEVDPDVLADITDLSAIPSGFADAVWTAHCVEHLYIHQVPKALAEFRRILKDDGFLCLIVPDLQTIAKYIVEDKLDETIYESPAGPVTGHDVLFGFGPAVALGYVTMSHRCGFAPTSLLRRLQEAEFQEIVLRRRPSLELAAVARKIPSASPAERERLLADLAL
jgi:ubiquinone/menaquinone biosynthesis C-methylase UbiE